MNVARVHQSREQWKKTAVERRKKIEATQRQIVRLRRKLADHAEANARLKARIAELESAADQRVSALVPLRFRSQQVRVVCVMFFLIGVVPCNAAARILGFLGASQRFPCDWIPDPSSIVNWLGRAGLGLLQGVTTLDSPWVAIIDTSISFGKNKALVCLRIRLDHFLSKKSAPTIADVQCIGMTCSEVWNGNTVAAALARIFALSGMPTAILKDGGSDLAKGVEILLALQRKEGRQVLILRDVGHVAANALKALYARNGLLGRFLAIIEKARAHMSQSDIAALRPPRLRTKGRYQGISRLVEWAASMAWYSSGRGRARTGTLAEALRKVLPGLASMRFFLQRFERDCRGLNKFLALLKNNGLSKETGRQAQLILAQLPRTSKLRSALRSWLDAHLALQNSLADDAPLLVSSDIIETVMGQLKNVIERMPLPEFSTLALTVPLFCGGQTEESIDHSLVRCSHKSLMDWRSENCVRTHRKRRDEILTHQLIETVQDPPIMRAA